MKRLICSLTFFLACIILIQARNYVVCVGIANYPGKGNDLNLSVTDVNTIKSLYDKNGNAYIVSFINEQATIDNVKSAIKKTFKKANKKDIITFFFSGHGVPGFFICYDGVLKYNELASLMARSKAKSKLVFADACYSGLAREKIQETNNTIEGSVLFFLSSRSDEVSIEKEWNWKNSLFTAFLDRGLRGGADTNKDHVITARELFLFVSNGVANASREKQHPVMWGRFSDDMPIMTWGKKK